MIICFLAVLKESTKEQTVEVLMRSYNAGEDLNRNAVIMAYA